MPINDRDIEKLKDSIKSHLGDLEDYLKDVVHREISNVSESVEAVVNRHTTEPVDESPSKMRIGYYTSWSVYNGFYVKDIPADKLTHVIYCFAKIDKENDLWYGDQFADVERRFSAAESVDGVADASGQGLKGNYNQLRKLKEKHPHLKVILALGGPSEEDWPEDANSASDLADSVGEFFRMKRHHVFDGLDIDWEFPDGVDDKALSVLVSGCRAELDNSVERSMTLSAWLPAAYWRIGPWRAVNLTDFNFVAIQGYDFYGQWNDQTNYHAALVSASDDTQYTFSKARHDWQRETSLEQKTDVVMSVPAYAAKWVNVRVQNGSPLYAPADGVSPVAFKDVPIKSAFSHGGKAFVYYEDSNIFYSLDTPLVASQKADYVNNEGLAGIALWELSQEGSDHPLTSTYDNELG